MVSPARNWAGVFVCIVFRPTFVVIHTRITKVYRLLISIGGPFFA